MSAIVRRAAGQKTLCISGVPRVNGRSLISLNPPGLRCEAPPDGLLRTMPAAPSSHGPGGLRSARWAELMRRSFGFDVLACPRCGGRLRLIALIEEASVIERILRHLGLPTEIPEPRPARAPPLPIDARARHVGDDATALDPC